MENLGQSILSVIITAMLCRIAVSMIPSEPGKAWIRLLCGLVLTITVIKPLSVFRDLEFIALDPDIWTEGDSISAQGEKLSQDAMEDIIKERCEAYIWDKANGLGISVSVDVSLSHDTVPIPVSVTLDGTLSPADRLALETIILEDLGITKESLRWKE